ncbi:MAG TPA: hypothetical protein VNT52_18140 [Acidimicrobiales bacterium]|nr:hypothetical protein [Acidimicrobiales bacterium]
MSATYSSSALPPWFPPTLWSPSPFGLSAIRRLLGGAIPIGAVDRLDERLTELQEEIDKVEVGEVNLVQGGTP